MNLKKETIVKVLEIRNPLLESIILYDNKELHKKGMLYEDKNHKSINRVFKLELQAKESKIYFLKVNNHTTALRFGIFLKDEISFLENDYKQQMIIAIFFSVILMLLSYNMLLYIYTKENVYMFYCFYLLTLMFQQATYLGILKMYLPQWFIYYDNLNVVFKVNIMYIAAGIFAKSFLQTHAYPTIDKIYNIIIFVAIIEIPLLGTPLFYYPEVAVVTAFVFVIFNIFASVYISKQGYTQARFFVLAWSFLVVGFFIMILDALGLISMMHKLSNLIIFLTAIEAIILSLAFMDRYIILKREKERVDQVLVNTLHDRQKMIEEEIINHTLDFKEQVENKKVLLRELHHRTKNNLQLILSLVRMHSDSDNKLTKTKYNDLEYRINAIAKTHQMLYVKEDLQKINMDDYINELCYDLENISDKHLIFEIQTRQIYMPLREASYVGLIVNELVTNSIKHVHLPNIFVSIDMHREKNLYILEIRDNGNGFEYKRDDIKGIGMKLVRILVEDQLEGTMNVSSHKGCKYTIEYKL